MDGRKTWDECKKRGSAHYKTGGTEPVDLYKDIKPHESLSAFAIKALTDNIKYSYRMLNKGVNLSDCDKVIHYTEYVIAEFIEKLPSDGQEK